MEVERELVRYGIEVAALQEIRWPDVGVCELEKGHILHSGSRDGAHMKGVGFYIRKELYTQIIEFERSNEE